MARLGQTIDILNQKGTPAFYTDTFANRPAFGFKGRVFIATDTAAIYEDTGTSWTLIADATGVVTTPTLQSVTTAGNTTTLDATFQNVNIGRGTNGIGTNTNIGANSGLYALGTSNNVSIGYGAIGGVSSSGSNNVAVGFNAGNKATQSQNVFIGSGAGQWTTGLGNTLVGYGADTGSSSFPNVFGSNATIVGGGSIGSSINSYTSYNTFIGYGTAIGYTGNGSNGVNTIIGALVSVSATPTMQNNLILGDNGGIHFRTFASGNTGIGSNVVTDNGIHTLQVAGGLNASTLSATGTTWSTNTTISSPSNANYYYVYTGAGLNTITLPTALNNNNIYVFINNTNQSYTISAPAGQNILQRNFGTLSQTFTAMMWSTYMLIADGNNKFYQIVS